MKRLMTLFLVVFILTGCSGKGVKVNSDERSLFYAVSKDGYETSYLLGTVHVGQSGYTLPESVASSMLSADLLVTEVDVLLSPFSPEVLEVAKLMISKTRLSDRIGKDRVMLLAETTNNKSLEIFEPWAVVLLLTYSVVPDDYKSENGIDMALAKYARNIGMERDALEAVMDSTVLFLDIPDSEVIAVVDDFFVNEKTYKKALVDMVSAVYKNDVKSLLTISKSVNYNSKFWDDFDKKLLDDRNKKWMPKIEEELAQQSTFVAVGALHLFGDNGLVRMLRAKGYTVTPLEY